MGNAMSVVESETFDGFCRVVVSGASKNSLPPFPPLPAMLTLDRVALPPKLLIPFISDSTSSGIPAIGIFPTVVFITTFAVPFSSTVTDDVSVTAEKNDSNGPLSSDCKGRLLKLRSKSAAFPVETPPSTAILGISS